MPGIPAVVADRVEHIRTQIPGNVAAIVGCFLHGRGGPVSGARDAESCQGSQ